MGNQNVRADIQATEQQIFELNQKLVALRKANPAIEVPNYTFRTQTGDPHCLSFSGTWTGCSRSTTWAKGAVTALCGQTASTVSCHTSSQ